MRYHTRILSAGDVISINNADGAYSVTMQSNSGGTCSFTGNFPFQGVVASAVQLTNGEGITIVAPALRSPLDGLTITCTAGTVDICMGF